MTWVTIDSTHGIPYDFNFGSGVYLYPGGRVRYQGEGGSEFSLHFDSPQRVRITALSYMAGSGQQGNTYHPARFQDDHTSYTNEAYPYPESSFPNDGAVSAFFPFETEFASTYEIYYTPTKATSEYTDVDEDYQFLVEIWMGEPEPEPPPPAPPKSYRVYELDKGWSFDGNYIPHFLELNWYFGDDPIHYHSLHKIRIHGLSKGFANLTVATNGMDTDYERDYSEPQIIDLPRNMKHLSTELLPETNTVTSANRGLSIQMKFEGRNTDITKPEPQHVIQVLALQSSPAGTGRRAE